MPSHSEICSSIREFLVSKVFNGEAPASLDSSSPLLSSRVLDSITVLELVAHLESDFGIEFRAHELDAGTMDTIDAIAGLVEKKLPKE